MSIQNFRNGFAHQDNTANNYAIIDGTEVDDILRGLLAHCKKLTQPLNTHERVVVIATTSEQLKVFLGTFLQLANLSQGRIYRNNRAS